MRWTMILLFLSLVLAACSSNPEPSSTAEGEPSEETQQEEPQEEPQGLQKKKQGSYADPIIKEEDVSVTPERVQIPSIGVDAFVEKVGTLANGQMGVPKEAQNTAWFEPGAKPGAKGSAVIAGHVGLSQGSAVFNRLTELEKGDEVMVTGEDGKQLTFVVTDRQVFPQNDAPVEDIFGYTARKTLNLITCTGDYIQNQGGHQDRLVVYTELK
ncbi:class F sortase [Halobacillus litoralis]|uniref:class F sortase n=1 Tax=Halobacillus litoralis TaxID=45668 RepID=UPI001CD402FA|nr:class F sortase [Halobacillus litoralis]MCA0970804.1 class F sortase [Halobacillus litoralis]